MWPNWVRRFLTDKGVIGGDGTVNRTTHSTDGGELAETWKGRTLDVRVKAVCEPCNNGWMSTIESDAKPAMEPLILGRQHRLPPPAQARVATWAFMASAMLQYANPAASVVPAAHYDEFYVFREPPPDVIVWTFALPRLRGNNIADSHVAAYAMKDRSEFSGFYVTTMSIGLFAVQVVGLVERATPIHVLAQRWDQVGMERIWPSTRRFIWPPQPVPASGSEDPLRECHERLRAE